MITETSAGMARNYKNYLMLFVVVLFGGGCSRQADTSAVPLKVEIVETATGYALLRDGERFKINGAGLEFGDVESFARHGGNSFRTWRVDNAVDSGQQVLDRAFQHGVTVSMCLPVVPERQGFDYDDKQAVAAQLERLREYVRRHRDHPALLTWIIGNELNLDATNPKVYDAVNDISKMIHELDPNHPTTTTVAGLHVDVLKTIEERAPDLDFISFQVYGELAILQEFIEENTFERPYFVTEWGAIGHWEMPKTSWGAPIELTSSEKAKYYLDGFQNILQPYDDQVLATYAFLWGQKQEKTPTWFGMFTESGEETETVDVMHYIWNGSWPENRSPSLKSLLLDGRGARDNVLLRPGEVYSAAVDVVDHDDDAIIYDWQIKPESDAAQVGGDFEESIQNLAGLIDDTSVPRIRFTAPDGAGAYRLFVYAYDRQGHAAHANVPFLVQP